MGYNFEVEIDKSRFSTMKWDAEIAERQDEDILAFGTADMDFLTAQPIRDALSSVIDTGHFGYPYIQDDYYNAIINWYKRRTHWDFSGNSIANSVGIYTSIATLIDALSNPGDEIIYQPPVHFCFKQIIEDNGRVALANPLINDNGIYKMDVESLKSTISDKTRLLMLCNPQNPIGKAWDEAELGKLAEFCLSHNVIIISDDVYSGLLYESARYTPIASLSKDTSNITVTCNSTSKSYNTTGIKHSYIIAENTELMDLYQRSLKKTNLNYGMNIMGIATIKAAYNDCDDWLTDLMDYVKGNFSCLEQFIRENMPKISLVTPEATYFAWLDYRKLGLSSSQLGDHFKNDVRIVIENGRDFGENGEGFIRMNLGCTRDILQKGLQRMKAAYDLRFG